MSAFNLLYCIIAKRIKNKVQTVPNGTAGLLCNQRLEFVGAHSISAPTDIPQILQTVLFYHERRRPITGKINKLKYTDPAKMQEAADAYFADCEGRPLTDESGEVVLNKNGSPVIVGAHPPTVTGLALWLGFKSRQSLLDYQHRSEKFNDILTSAKSKCEEYAERRLFDRDGVTGAKFSLTNNFKGWSEKPKQAADKSGKELPQLYNALMEDDKNDVH